ncbi:MAG TPA: hypothetical protein VGK67_17205 [Myxococcales bacterium]|jgi:hypothetical protein
MGWKGNVAWAFGTMLCLASVLLIASIPYQLCLGGGASDAHGAGPAYVDRVCSPDRPGLGTLGVMMAVVGVSAIGWRLLRKDLGQPASRVDR